MQDESADPRGLTHVLVVEDVPLVSRALVRMLPRDRFTAEVVETRQAARDRLAEEPRPDVVLVDRGLPDGDGVELVLEVGQRWALPAVVMSGDLVPSEVEVPWLSKPFQRATLLEALERALRSRTPAS